MRVLILLLVERDTNRPRDDMSFCFVFLVRVNERFTRTKKNSAAISLATHLLSLKQTTRLCATPNTEMRAKIRRAVFLTTLHAATSIYHCCLDSGHNIHETRVDSFATPEASTAAVCHHSTPPPQSVAKEHRNAVEIGDVKTLKTQSLTAMLDLYLASS